MEFKMVIKKVAVGNSEEAFVEDTFSSGLNIISSDDNNKGKTIVIQSIMYTLGNVPAFPVSFEYEKYQYYLEFENNSTTYHLCRIKDTFVLRYDSIFMTFDSVSELKHYWTKHIFELPTITKNQISKIVDPELFVQLFFVGQDKKDTSNISNSGLYNKQDYYNMVYDIVDAGGIELTDDEITQIKSKISTLSDEKKTLLKQFKILKSHKTPVGYFSSTNDKEEFAKKVTDLEKIREKIEELRKSRNREATRSSKWKITIKELNSLNRILPKGELRCMDCNSSNISFSTSKNGGYSFDVSTAEMRSEILHSIEEKIKICDEEIERISHLIEQEQEKLKNIMSDEKVTLEALVAFKEDIFSASDAENKIQEINKKIDELQSQLNSTNKIKDTAKEKQCNILKQIIDEMNSLYKEVDPAGNQVYSDIFTKRGQLYSGSDETIFHEIKLYSLTHNLKLCYPIIIDSFRAEDLSTQKEEKIIELFRRLDNQIIFTTTLKEEEIGKYDELDGINHIDYSLHTPSKILSKDYLLEFTNLLSIFNLKQ